MKGIVLGDTIRSLRASGFHVFCGNRISPDEETAMKNLIRHVAGK